VLFSASCAQTLLELLVDLSMMMGSSTVSPCASISIVTFSAVSDGVASISSAAGGLFVGVVSVAPEGCFPSVLAVADFLFAGSC